MTDQPTPQAAVWIDGDPLMEAIAATVHEHCEHSDSGLVIDDPRNIAAWAAAAMRAVPVVPVSSPPPDQTALRDRIAEAVQDGPTWMLPRSLAEEVADEVLAVLPPPADRAAVLREAADGFDRHAEQILDGVGNKAVFVAKALRDQAAVWREAAETLRRLAAEAQQPDTETPKPASRWGVCDGCGAAAGPDCDCPPDTGDDHSCAESGCTGEPEPVHKGGNADDCPACIAGGLDTIGPPYECPGPDRP